MSKRTFCVIVPAFNEEKVIEASLNCLKKIIPPDRIYVVSDGSQDNTVLLARHAQVNVMGLKKNIGKAQAILKLLKTRALTKNFKYILFSDADSQLSQDFIKPLKAVLKTKPACIVGTVKSDRHGLISAYRTYEYGYSHLIFKNAQSATKTIAIAPGCASLYRSDVLEKLNFFNGTLTEDFDLTIQIHQQKLGEVVFIGNAAVITQDPSSLKDYWQQVLRWNTGFWQNIFLHRLYLPTQKINLEVMLLMLDVLVVVFSIYYAWQHPSLLFSFLKMMLTMMIFFPVAILLILRQFWAMLYVPIFPIFYLINLTAYFTGFFRSLLGKKRILSWAKVTRYHAGT